MAAPPPASPEPNPIGCLGAIAIGVLVVAGEAGAFSLLTGRPLNLSDQAGVFLFQMLSVAAPFGLLALAGARRALPWLTGLALTLALWGYALVEGVRYQRHPDGTGADIGLGLIMLASPLVIAAAALAAHAWQRRRGG